MFYFISHIFNCISPLTPPYAIVYPMSLTNSITALMQDGENVVGESFVGGGSVPNLGGFGGGVDSLGLGQCNTKINKKGGRDERQRNRLRGGGKQPGNTITKDQKGDNSAGVTRGRGKQTGNVTTNRLRWGGGDGRRWRMDGRW